MSENGGMTKHDREELLKLIRRREKLAKEDVKRLAAERKADFAEQLAERFKPTDDLFRSIVAEVEAKVEAAEAQIEERCAAAGIRADMRPSLFWGWRSRGENMESSRRVEMKHREYTRIDAQAKQAMGVIDRRSVEIQEKLMVGGLQSEEARAFLETMPTAEELMPRAPMAAIEKVRTLTALPEGEDEDEEGD